VAALRLFIAPAGVIRVGS